MVVAPIAGASLKNKITFQAKTKHGAALESSHRPGDVVTFVLGTQQQPLQWVIMDGFRFVRADNVGIAGWSHTTDIEIKNCRFETGILSTQLSVSDGKRWDIHHNVRIC